MIFWIPTKAFGKSESEYEKEISWFASRYTLDEMEAEMRRLKKSLDEQLTNGGCEFDDIRHRSKIRAEIVTLEKAIALKRRNKNK